MTTIYKYKKCDSFGFATSKDIVLNKYPEAIFIDNDINEITNYNNKDKTPVFIFDLESDLFSDIIIRTEENDNKAEHLKRNEKETTNANYKRDENELNKIMTGQSAQLDAFSKNVYTVIYGKKTANINNGNNNTHIFNHSVIDSLARNGVIADPIANHELSIHKVMRELEKLDKFKVFFIHTKLDLEYTEHESPNEISHPIYIKGLGEITAVAYRALILRFFPSLTIVSESMRENAYLF